MKKNATVFGMKLFRPSWHDQLTTSLLFFPSLSCRYEMHTSAGMTSHFLLCNCQTSQAPFISCLRQFWNCENTIRRVISCIFFLDCNVSDFLLGIICRHMSGRKSFSSICQFCMLQASVLWWL